MEELTHPKKSGKFFYWGLALGIIAATLTLIVVPSFIRFNGPPPTKQSEARQNLKAIFAAQVVYFGEHDTFASGLNCFDHLSWKPEGNTRYGYYCGEEEIKCTNCKSDCPYPNLSAASDDAFTVMAVGNIDKDDYCDVWTVDDAKHLLNVRNDVQE